MTIPALETVAPSRFADVRARVARFDELVRAATGHPALGDAVWRDLAIAPPESLGVFADDIAYAHVGRVDNATHHWTCGLAARVDSPAEARTAMLHVLLAHVAAHGGGAVDLWVLGAGDADDPALIAAGFRFDRALHEMRVPLPLAVHKDLPAGFTIRAFQPGIDDDAWLDLNNRAFAGHAEQGAWTAATLQARQREPWFDPSLFLLAFDHDGMAGFNWLKVHPAHGADPERGEIYVIGVDPRTQGTGLGAALASAGMDTLAARGITTGMLFCAADNTTAVHLYGKLGFTVHRTDRAYTVEVPQP